MASYTISNEEFMEHSRLHLGCIFIDRTELDRSVYFIYWHNIGRCGYNQTLKNWLCVVKIRKRYHYLLNNKEHIITIIGENL